MKFICKHFNELSAAELYEILKARCAVFMVEQKIICQDMDGVDYLSLHCYLTEGDTVVGYLRAFVDAEDASCVRIGRVLTLEHGKGVGRLLMEKSLPEIAGRFGCKKFILNAQKYAAGYYEKFGFTVTSQTFLEEGIPHVRMELSL